MQLKAGGIPHLRLNNDERPIANKYREGKMKRTLKRESKVREIVKREAYTAGCVPVARVVDWCAGDVWCPQGRLCLCTHVPFALQVRDRLHCRTRLETRTKESNKWASK